VDNQRLEDFLRLLDDHKVSVDAVAGLDRTVRALAVSNGERAALAIIDGDRVGLLEIRETGIAREIVKVLPGAVPGPGTAVNVRVQCLQDAVVIHEAERAADASDLFAGGREALEQAGMSAQDAKQFEELASNRVAGGQFGATQDRQRSRVVINWFDAHQGRYLIVNSDGSMCVSPADNSTQHRVRHGRHPGTHVADRAAGARVGQSVLVWSVRDSGKQDREEPRQRQERVRWWARSCGHQVSATRWSRSRSTVDFSGPDGRCAGLATCRKAVRLH